MIDAPNTGSPVWWDAMDQYVARRRGWRWAVMCISGEDGLERDAAAGARFWKRLTAERVAVGLRKAMMDALWRARAHPYQHGVVPVAAVGALTGGPRA